MVNNEQLQAAAAHIFDTFDDALDRLGKTPENAVELLHMVAKHAATRVDLDGRTANDAEMTWAATARKFMGENPNIVAVVTIQVDKTGIVTPLASTKDMPAMIGETLRSATNEFVVNICRMLFGKPFRCGCPTCRNGGAQELRDAMAEGRVSGTKTKFEA